MAVVYPILAKDIEIMLPKKTAIKLAKISNYHLNLVICNKIVWFFNIRDGPYLPTLRTIHKYPDILPRLVVDVGAIPFVMKGANVFCGGLTSPGGNCDIKLDKLQPCAIYAEGKTHALAVGITKLSTEDIKTINKGPAVDTLHYLNDGLWKMPTYD